RYTAGISMRTEDIYTSNIQGMSVLISTYKIWKENTEMYSIYKDFCENRLFSHWKLYQSSVLSSNNTERVYDTLELLNELEKTYSKEELKDFLEAMYLVENQKSSRSYYQALGIKNSLKGIIYHLVSLVLSLINRLFKNNLNK
ncbi:MAG: hypothetical protein ACRCTJ_06945, partial [Brevinema sp.]